MKMMRMRMRMGFVEMAWWNKEGEWELLQNKVRKNHLLDYRVPKELWNSHLLHYKVPKE